jgi:hypothetical protein
VARNRKLADIRFFESVSLPGPEEPSPIYAGDSIYSGFDAKTTAFGARVASKCRELGVSVGHRDHLYIVFTPALQPGDIVPLSKQTEVWNRFVAFGLPASFNGKSAEERFNDVASATFSVLRAVATEGAQSLGRIAALHEQFGDDMRVVLKQKEYGSIDLRVTQTFVPTPRKCELWLEAVDKFSGRRVERAITPLKRDDDGRFLVQRILLRDGIVTVHPYTSAKAHYYTQGYCVPFMLAIHELSSSTSRSTRSRAERAPG